MTQPNDFYDPLIAPRTGHEQARFFDRFMFNMHPNTANSPSIITGFGHYPGRNVADGYTIISLGDEQRNVRFSTELNATAGNGTGPLRFECLEPNQAWRLQLTANPTGLEYDVVWRARTPFWLDVVKVNNDNGIPTNFEHLVQSGRYEGSLSLDGVSQSVQGWYGQRDRSRGVRTMSGGQGLHLWLQAQFEDRAVGFLLVEDRQGKRILVDGAVMLESGRLDYVKQVQHNLVFEQLDLVSGELEIHTLGGAIYTMVADASAGGGFMAGAGYGGQHGKARGLNYLEHDIYPLDGSINQRTLDSSLTDRLTTFTWGEQTGYGIFEFALSRSASYSYQPTL